MSVPSLAMARHLRTRDDPSSPCISGSMIEHAGEDISTRFPSTCCGSAKRGYRDVSQRLSEQNVGCIYFKGKQSTGLNAVVHPGRHRTALATRRSIRCKKRQAHGSARPPFERTPRKEMRGASCPDRRRSVRTQSFRRLSETGAEGDRSRAQDHKKADPDLIQSIQNGD